MLLAACPNNNPDAYKPSGKSNPNTSAIDGLPHKGGTALVEICARSKASNGGTNFTTALGSAFSNDSPQAWRGVSVLTAIYEPDGDGKVRITRIGAASFGRGDWSKIIKCA
jgi:hypothetical protein